MFGIKIHVYPSLYSAIQIYLLYIFVMVIQRLVASCGLSSQDIQYEIIGLIYTPINHKSCV